MKFVKQLILGVVILLLATFDDIIQNNSSFYKEGYASYYTISSSSPLTASGELFNENSFTCAIWDVPFNTILKVTNIENDRFTFCRVNDRGMAKRFLLEGRIIDLTPKAFKELSPLKKGLIKVRITLL